MLTRWTTRCCSAAALIAAISRPSAAPVGPLSLFPVQPLWTIDLNSQLSTAPAYDGTIGYFAIRGGRLAAYDLAAGTRKWVVDATPQLEPAAGGGLIFLAEPEMLTARRSTDGSIAWQLPFAATLAVPLVWDNGWLIAATEAREVLAFSATDGRLIWHRQLSGSAHACPTLAADRVYVPTDDGHVSALRVDTGEPIWERSVNAAANDILSVDDRLYVGSNDNHLYCILADDGSIDWKWPTGGDVIGRPVHDAHNVYFVSLDNVLRALDLKSGGQRWKTPLPLRPVGGATLAGDALIVTGLSAKVAAYKTADGKPAGDVPAGAEIIGPPHLITGAAAPRPVVVFVTHDFAKGATVTAITRSIDPAIAPFAPLPNITPVAMPATPALPKS